MSKLHTRPSCCPYSFIGQGTSLEKAVNDATTQATTFLASYGKEKKHWRVSHVNTTMNCGQYAYHYVINLFIDTEVPVETDK